MLKFAAGVIATFVVLGLAGLAVVETGAFDVRASTPHSAFVGWATHTTMIHAAQRGAASIHAPDHFLPGQVRAGFALYQANCVQCHGGPGVPRASWTRGLTPSPPFLVDAPRHWSAAELDWIVTNGVKMTAMPAWQGTMAPAQIWNVVALLESFPDTSPQAYAQMTLADQSAAHPAAAPASPSPPGAPTKAR